MNVTDPSDPRTQASADEAEFRLVVTHHERRTVVELQGEMDLATADEVRRALAAQHGPVLVDLRELSFIDVAGLRVLLEADARSRSDGANLRFVRGASVRRVFELAGLPDQLMYADPEGS